MELNNHKIYREYESVDVNDILENGRCVVEPWELANVYGQLHEQNDKATLQEVYDTIRDQKISYHGDNDPEVYHEIDTGLYYGAIVEDVLREEAEEYGGKEELLKSVEPDYLFKATIDRLETGCDNGAVAGFFREATGFNPEEAISFYGKRE